jgi:hypothetical protein
MHMSNQMNFPSIPKVQWVNHPGTANTTKNGAGTLGTSIFTVFTSSDVGSFVRSIKVLPLGTNVATVMRVFVNNGSDNNTAANNSLIGQITLPATTNSEIAQIAEAELALNQQIQADYRILVTIGTAVASGFSVTAFGADF